MYQLVRARYRKDRRAGRWVEADLSNALVSTLATVYGEVMLYITYAGFPGQKALRFDKTMNFRRGIDTSLTVQAWLTSVGNTTLPWETTLPNETVRLVEYGHAWHMGYDIQTRGRHTNIETLTSAFVQEDLMLTHPKFDPQYIDEHCLFTVNGFVHLSDWGTDGVRIVDGNSTVRKSNDNQVGLISFENIGKIRKVPITEAMLSKQNENTPYYQTTYVTMPDDVDMENKTVLLVLGGYLHPFSKSYVRVSDRAWRIELQNILFLERYIESVKGMNMDQLGLSDDPENRTLFSVEEMQRDSAMLGYLTMSQSFFVVIDAPSMFHELEPLEYAGFPGRYLNRDGRQLPVVGAYGRTLDYHTIHEHGYYVYVCTNNFRFDYSANFSNWTRDRLVNGGLYPHTPRRPAQAYLRILGTDA
ncbi:virion structural protein [Pseudomonas phage Noxifer]|uniref:Virion structural protein n=1 Tax=Pseudomonas phage Noxifer TaxID=2006684 RepID=A0A1Y0SXI2_9CAUD|nr:virion structural protein [Pseudomonas phage Noxifer]ARV77324.1 virion structural protein [Pseudomonas phage Noxifer]